MPAWPSFLPLSDIAPGDTRTRSADWSGLRLVVVESIDDPHFEEGYRRLETEFGWRGELETREVLARRFACDPARPACGCAILYRMMLLYRGDLCLGIRDHTAIVMPGAREVVVHLSHILVPAEARRTGVAGLLRALPLQTARACALAAGQPDLPVTLLVEMDPWNPARPESVTRMTAYAKAGYRSLPADLGYLQPDFRPPAIIDAAGGPQPLPLQLNLLRLGRETETSVPAAEVVRCIRALYALYAVAFRPGEMRPCLDWLSRLPDAEDTRLPLQIPPGLLLA